MLTNCKRLVQYTFHYFGMWDYKQALSKSHQTCGKNKYAYAGFSSIMFN